MATKYSETPLPPHNADAHPWPTYRSGGHHYPVSLYLVPGIQAPDLVHGDGTFYCDITNTHASLGPGIGTLFQRSFENLDDASAVSAAAMRMGQQAIRQRVLEQVIQETMHAQHTLLLALTALKADDLDRYVSLCNDADGLTCLLSTRTSWLAGIIAIAGGPEDPLLRRFARSPRTEASSASPRRKRRTR